MTLTVLSVGFPLAPVGPDAIGGAEQVLSLLDEALARAGHRSIVIAPAGSTTAGVLIATPAPERPLDDAARVRAQAQHRRAIRLALRRETIDVVHLHGVDFPAYLPPPGPPVLATLHLPPSFYPAEVFVPARPRTSLICVSASQYAACPPSRAILRIIPNGVRLDHHAPGHEKRSHVLALGRICPEKGFHLALLAAARARVPMILAGQVFAYEAHERYFRAQIVPLLDEDRRFIGPVALAPKRALLASARCLLVPSQVAETSSLVAREALACGTPVVAFRAGALPELIDHGRTGFLVDSVDEMAAAIGAAASIKPEDCRRTAEARCSAERMAEDYLDVYQRLAGARGEAALHE